VHCALRGPARSTALGADSHPGTYNPEMRRGPSLPIAALALSTLVVVAASCNSDKASTPPTVITEPVPLITRADDGVLTIGVLTPLGSAFADIGQSIGKGAQLAVDNINDAGGFGGNGVKLISEDEDVQGSGLEASIDKLIGDNVDAIVGPASSTDALSGLGEIIDAGVVACSPTASASMLDDFPDNNLFFRTIPSDTLQGAAIAEAVDQTGATQATIVYIDDAYGQAFQSSVSDALRRKQIDESHSIAYSNDNESIEDASSQVASIGTGVVVVIGDATSGPVMLEAIDAKERTVRPRYVVNDAMRRPGASAQPMPEALATRVTGVSPIAYSTNEKFLAALGATADNPRPFAANAYDCVNLIALAAWSASSTQPIDIASFMPSVSASGTPCMSFAECRDDLIARSNINYDGPSGSLTLDANGDVTDPTFALFTFKDGRDVDEGTVP
jgi:branched-chain amino acid transport system substrate-binding protein